MENLGATRKVPKRGASEGALWICEHGSQGKEKVQWWATDSGCASGTIRRRAISVKRPITCHKIANLWPNQKLVDQYCWKNGKCFVCLAKGHIKSKCKLTKRCGKCEKTHHVILCGVFKRVTRQKKTENGKTGKQDSESTETNSSNWGGTQVDEKQESKSMLVDAKDWYCSKERQQRSLILNAFRMQWPWR